MLSFISLRESDRPVMELSTPVFHSESGIPVGFGTVLPVCFGTVIPYSSPDEGGDLCAGEAQTTFSASANFVRQSDGHLDS